MSKGGQAAMVKQLYKGRTALHVAARSGFLDAACTLVNAGADVGLEEQQSGCTPILLAVERLDLEMTKVSQ